MSEMNFLVTDSSYRHTGAEYLYKTLYRKVHAMGGAASSGEDGVRSYFSASVPIDRAKYFRPLMEDKLADVIAVNYKYDYFKRYIRVSGLKSVEYEILLSALISADIEEDKRYIRSRLCGPTYAIDGSYNFTMKALTEKWRDIVGYIPPYFDGEKLKDFVSYIVADKKGGRVRVADSKVYDDGYNVLCRCYLAGSDDECRLTKEIIMSGAGDVQFDEPVPETDEYYLKRFFGDKIFFGKGV